jgi:DNA-directed RNA polymerase specialized sigma subunit
MRSDFELLREYAENRSEPAFDLLVEKYLRLVYSTAL